MKRLLSSKAFALASLACVSAGIGALVACSSSSATNNGNPQGGSDSGGGEGGPPATLTCASPKVPILFSPMYSAYVTDSTQQTFQIPAVVNDNTIDPKSVTWGASDPSFVEMATDPTTGGTMITIKKPGTVQIIAKLQDGSCGASELNITSATEAQWSAGNTRYNDNNPVDFGCLIRGMAFDGGTCSDAGPGCTQCHGPTALGNDAGFGFVDIAHTPEQTGGFSDDDLTNIITHGIVPGCAAEAGAGTMCPTADSGYFDPNIISYRRWQRFHHYEDIQGDTLTGIIVYLRSLAPAPQDGTSNFGGRRDGGPPRFDGGFPGDGGFPMPDSGTSTDAGGGADATAD